MAQIPEQTQQKQPNAPKKDEKKIAIETFKVKATHPCRVPPKKAFHVFTNAEWLSRLFQSKCTVEKDQFSLLDGGTFKGTYTKREETDESCTIRAFRLFLFFHTVHRTLHTRTFYCTVHANTHFHKNP